MFEGWKPCPLCGDRKRMRMTMKEDFMRLQDEGNDHSAALRIECGRCELQLWDFTFDEKDYDNRCEILREKWNRLPRRGDMLEPIERGRVAIEVVRQALYTLEKEWSENP